MEPHWRARLVHRVINHPITAYVYRAMHPDFGLWLVDRMSPMLGDGSSPNHLHLEGAAIRQQAWAARALADDPSLGLVVMGHTHHAATATMQPGRQYLNPGAWFDRSRYAIATETDITLHQFGA
jgi:hypothetical protein